MPEGSRHPRQLYLALTPRRLARSLWRRGLFSLNPVRARRSAHRPRRPQSVVLVADVVGPRVCKIGRALKSIGWRVILLCSGDPWAEASKCFDEISRYESAAEALFLATRFRPVAYHVFSLWDFAVAALFIRLKPGKIVFDDYDVIAGMISDDYLRKHYPRQSELERYCLENADALCCRSLETQYAKRHLGYRFRCRRMLLLDGCWDNHAAPRSREGAAAEGLHIVYCGNVPLKSEEGASNSRNNLIEFARSLADQRVHLHLYPASLTSSETFEDTFSDYIELAKETPFCHLHRPVPADALTQEMSQYDAGLFDLRLFSNVNEGVYTPWKYVYASANKMFDYLDAGLPVIVRASKFEEFLLMREGVAVRVEKELSGNTLQSLRHIDWKSMKSNVARSRSRFSLGNHVQRLASFYESL